LRKYLEHKHEYIRKNAYLACIPKSERDVRLFIKALAEDTDIVKDAIIIRLLVEDMTIPAKGPTLHERIASGRFRSEKEKLLSGYADYIRAYISREFIKLRK
jgi:hypothetical protein